MAVTISMFGALASCGHADHNDSDLGSATMEIGLPGGSTINTVSYTISGNGIPPIMGTVDVSGAGATVSFLITGIPTGTGYDVTLSATSTDGTVTCTGHSTFDVVANTISHVTVVLQCTGGHTGGVQVNGIWCPELASYSVSPLTVAIGGHIDVSAMAADIDTSDDATPTYAWTASAGSFANATAATTTYTCATAGMQTLTIKVSATSPTVDVSACDDSKTVTVTCVGLTCGNGVVDPGEECDPPNGTSCDSNCLQVPICGNGVVEAPAGPYLPEQCDPPNGTTCSSTCQNIPIVCGNGIVQPGEQCDPPDGVTCGPTCQFMTGPTCGDGVINQPSEECEPPNTPPGNFTPACDANCKIGAPSNCSTCEATKCDGFFGSPGAWGCAGLTGAAKANCQAIVDCVRSTHCAQATSDAQACYCGTAGDLACLTGAANGACKAKYEAAAGTTDPGTIAGLFTDPSSPVGLADNEITCDADTSAPTCTNVCPL
jgi:hypothetical protein